MESDKETVLIFTDWYLPGYKAGGPIQSCANLVDLLGDTLKFKVVCSDRDYLESEAYRDVSVNEWIQVGKAEVMYLPPDSQKLGRISSLIEEVNPGSIYLNGIFSFRFTILPLIASRSAKFKIIVAPRGMLAPAAMRIKSFKKTAFLKLAKIVGLFSQVRFHATNKTEEDQIKDQFGKVPISVVENVPVSMHPGSKVENRRKEKNVLRLYTVARIAPEKNVLFGLTCLSQVRSDISVHIDIIGPIYNEGYFHQCEKMVDELPQNVCVRFLGPLTHTEISKIAGGADFFFLPTAGENYGHAIVEALFMGVPVIISTKTPWRDLEDKNLGFDLDLIENEFSKTINQVGEWSTSEYEDAYKNITLNAAALINVNKLRTEYTKIFDGRDRS
jgi:glycosyltransferase involved in cell wall biosynthesis